MKNKFKCPVEYEIKTIRKLIQRDNKNGDMLFTSAMIIEVELQHIEEKIKSLLFPEERTCEWYYEKMYVEYPARYYTGCGIKTDAKIYGELVSGESSAKIVFCPYCGGRITGGEG